MQLARRQQLWDPLKEFEAVSNRFNRWFGAGWPFGDKESLALADWAPAVNISETETEYRIRAELPNVKKDDVHVTLEGGVLTIQGDRREERDEKGIKYHRRELVEGHFLRQFAMPDDADESKVDAKFKDGVLDLTIAKAKNKAPKAKQISVQ